MTQGGFGGNFMTQTHDYRMARVRVSLEGLSVGDAFGEQYFGEPSLIESLIHSRTLRPAPSKVTDDTLMSLSIVDVLAEHGHIDRDRLAQLFGYRYKLDPHRGYGGTAHEILHQLALGVPWHVAARGVFDGAGSMGNGGAMRAAPIGGYFADDLARAAEEARKSAEVTHAHPEGQAGAMAVSVAAAWVASGGSTPQELFDAVLAHTPAGETHDRIAKASSIPSTSDVRSVTRVLGNGSRVISQDTVPFVLWCAAHHRGSFEDTLWVTVSGLGDRDTTCAMVGGIIALHADCRIPEQWIRSREALDAFGLLRLGTGVPMVALDPQ